MRVLKSIALVCAMGGIAGLASGCFGSVGPSFSDGSAGIGALSPAAPHIAIEGKWIPVKEESKNIYYNEFKRGRFAAYTADGTNTLALGSYKITQAGAEIVYFSEAQKREVKGVCSLISPDQLSCAIEGEAIIRLQRDT